MALPPPAVPAAAAVEGGLLLEVQHQLLHDSIYETGACCCILGDEKERQLND
jgi:hypothetical protein